MENPFAAISQVNPQAEDGFRRIANDVYKALMSARLSGTEYAVVMCVIHCTWGFGELSGTIALSQICEATSRSRSAVTAAIRELRRRRMILADEPSDRASLLSPAEYMFNKHYDTWRQNDSTGPMPENSTMPENRTVPESSSDVVRKSGPSKERRSKERGAKKIQKQRDSDHQQVVDHWFARYRELRGVDPPFDSREGRAAKRLLEKYGHEKHGGVYGCKLIIDGFFDLVRSGQDDWITRTGTSLRTFEEHRAQGIFDSLCRDGILPYGRKANVGQEPERPRRQAPLLRPGEADINCLEQIRKGV